MVAGACAGGQAGGQAGGRDRGYAGATGGIYTYYRACMFSLFLLLRWGGHCEWFCVSTGLFTGCG
jgi:hypothetical protein